MAASCTLPSVSCGAGHHGNSSWDTTTYKKSNANSRTRATENNMQWIHTETLPKHPPYYARLYSWFPPRKTATTGNRCNTSQGIRVANTSCHEIDGFHFVRFHNKGLLTGTRQLDATPRECAN